MRRAILNVILYAFTNLMTLLLTSFVKRIQNDAQYDVMRDAK